MMIALLATGGTVSATQDLNGEYKAGVLGVDELLKGVDGLLKFGRIQAEQIANIDSCDMNDEIWLKLAKRCEELLPKVQSIIITHGTDTMEETAFFLSLVLKAEKSIILTGSMRPYNSLSFDGTKNIYNAFVLANSKAKGVMITMNDKIFSPKMVSKTHTVNVDAFEFGELGFILGDEVKFHRQNLPPTSLNFELSSLKSLPKVDILYTYSNDGLGIAAKALFENGTQGIVVAGSGCGNIHKAQKTVLKELLKKGLKVVVSSRVKEGFVSLSQEDRNLGFIQAGCLNPQKARVLLMLLLAQGADNEKISNAFNII